MLCGKLAYPLNDLKRIHKCDLLLGWWLVLHARIIHVFDMHRKREDSWLKPRRLTARPEGTAACGGLKPDAVKADAASELDAMDLRALWGNRRGRLPGPKPNTPRKEA